MNELIDAINNSGNCLVMVLNENRAVADIDIQDYEIEEHEDTIVVRSDNAEFYINKNAEVRKSVECFYIRDNGIDFSLSTY